MPARIDIVLPGLFDLPLAELGEAFVRERLPRLNRMLGRADPTPNGAFDIDAILARALGLADTGGAGLPLAQAQLEPDDAAVPRALLCEAVHLRPDLRSAVLVPIGKDRRNLRDIHRLIDDLTELFGADLATDALPDGRFLVRLRSLNAPRHYPHLLSVLGKSVSPYVEQSRDYLPWYRLLNELQMFLHQHRVNAERAAEGLLPINSLWFWGGGPAPARRGVAVDWYGDDALLERFAARLGLGPRPLAAFASAAAGDAIVVDLRLLETLKSVRADPLDALLLDLEQRVFAPACALAERGGHRLSLCAGFEADFELGPYSRLRFWRRPRSLLDWRVPDGAG